MPEPDPRPIKLTDQFDLIGGSETCLRLSDQFHQKVAQDPQLRCMFPKNMHALTGRFALFIGERIGGPRTYTEKRGKQSLVCRHAHLSISTEEAEKWLAHMSAAMEDAGITEPARARLREFFTETAQTLTDPFLPYYQLPLDELRARLQDNPKLLGQSQMGHSLLRDAVCKWDAPRVRLLLESGADATPEEPLGHGLLYRAANSVVPGSEAAGCEIVELLIRRGVDVNQHSGPGKSTPLHMAARRGNVLLADSLLKSGADIEAKDSKGETPLRRAVNCQQEPFVRFLLSRGANPKSQDRQGQTPKKAARTDGIRNALQQRRNGGP